MGTSKSRMIFLIYIGIDWYLKPWLEAFILMNKTINLDLDKSKPLLWLVMERSGLLIKAPFRA